ncbi:TonB-dependent receptor plug domain-containing protein [Algoriphagus limi]|uniref:TonB-dependent receptor plug domain-containing protein n=1 Tax=Algoriphagus limi TaxID=2975273 RepID=A0ABT2G890_9BACT|nr:TonB-dependent receptor plug domain-containing protein [Algoriphagus limi]MCS5491510.1 TonB-dependent receptor plug domain-containing protein [Algoriphagus limi]
MLTRKFLFGFLALFCLSQPLFSQDLPKQIQEYFDTYQKESPPEKVHLHFDKHTFTLGEDLWFSAYLVAGSSQIPSPLSKTLYVDLFDGDGLLLEQRIVRLENGRGKGDFSIPLFGKPGMYRVKAYTAWMRNFGEEYFFTNEFMVIDGAAGSFLPQLTVSEISTQGGKVTYQTQISAINQSGNPIAGETIELIIKGSGEEIHKQNLLLNADGQASFSFSIPEKAFEGLHAELTYLENGNYPVSKKIRLPYSLSFADIQFLPEGGNWVLGKKANLAFRAVAPDGEPLQIKGQIQGEEISFESNFAGLGKFEITPSKKDYLAQIVDPSTGESRTINLPEPQEMGLAMQVIDNPKASYLTVFIQGNTAPSPLLLVSQTRGIINYMIQGTLTNGVWGVRIPKENLIAGVNQISVLNESGIPVLERLIFVQPSANLSLNANLVGNLQAREKLRLELESKIQENPTSGTFSLAVLDAGQVQDESEFYGTIASNLLLSSDLPGRIHNPGYYFRNQEPETLAALDIVMLTHGWRRITWNEVLENKIPEVNFFIERGINIEGQVTDQEDTRRGLSGGKITALVGEGIEIVTSEFGPNGRFIFRDLEYQDSAKVTITAEDNRLKNFIDVEVIRPEPVFTEIKGKYPNQLDWPKSLIESYEARILMKQLNEDPDLVDLEGVTVEGQTIVEGEEDVRRIFGSGDVTIDPEKIPASVGYTNVFQLIQGRVSGVQVFVNGLDVSVQIRGVGSLSSGTEPLYLLDNFPVDAATLLQVNPRDVASVDVFKDPARAAIFGSQGANGVIAVYTKTGGGSYQSVGGTLVTTYGGYSIAREFYQPDYSEKTTENAITDKRATIYWNPLVEIDESGKIQFEYFNTDQSKRHLIIVEGMDQEGHFLRFSRIFE